MEARTLLLTTLGSGALLGLVLGVTTSTVMKPAPEPPWRHAARTAVSTDESSQFVDAGPQDLSPYYWDASSRIPTWKRRAALEQAVYVPMTYADYRAQPDQPAAEAIDQQSVAVDADEGNDDAASAAEEAADDARSAGAPGDIAAQSPAPRDADEDAAATQ